LTIPVTVVNTSSDTWQILINRVNQIANLVSNAIVTVDATLGGSVTTGNTAVNGFFTATTVSTPALRGGNNTVQANLAISTNVAIGGSNVFISTAGGISTVGQVSVGANVVLTTSSLGVGNSTVNVVVNSTSVSIAGANAATVNNRAAANSYTRSKFNFIPGQNITITVSDDSAGNQINVQINSTATAASVSAAGGNTQVQFNDSGSFGASAGLTFNKSANNLAVSNTIFASGSVGVSDGSSLLSHVLTSTSGTAAQLIDSWSTTTYRAGFYDVSIRNSSANGYQVAQLTMLQDGSDTHLSEFGVISSNGSLGFFTANVNGTTARLYFTPSVATSSVRATRSLIVI
jgi:hypothetical protein